MARDPRTIEDRFHHSLRLIIDEKLAQRREELENGAALDQYRELVGYIRALKDAIDWAEEVERNQYGPRPG